MALAFFEPESEEFNIYRDKKGKGKNSGFLNDINWKPQQLELFEELKKIKQNIWIQIYDVYLDKNDNVTGIGFRITPEGSFYHQYPSVHFDVQGNITDDLQEDLEFYKEEDKEDDPGCLKLVKNFYKTLINLQNKQKLNKN